MMPLLAKNDGANGCSCALKLLLCCESAVTCTTTEPVVVSSGASTLICVGLMYSTYAGLPSIVTDTPWSVVGSCPFTKSVACHTYVFCDRLVPKIASHPAGAR